MFYSDDNYQKLKNKLTILTKRAFPSQKVPSVGVPSWSQNPQRITPSTAPWAKYDVSTVSNQSARRFSSACLRFSSVIHKGNPAEARVSKRS